MTNPSAPRNGVPAGRLLLVVIAMLTLAVPQASFGRSPGSRRPAADSVANGFQLPATARQVVVGIAEDWDASVVVLRRYERRRLGWQAIGDPWAARIGPVGLAWGRGLHPIPAKAQYRKREGDKRAPAGVFELTETFGYDPAWADRSALPYTAVTARDLFVSDPASPSYNRHIRIDHDPATPWERAQQMNQRDPAHALEVFVAHNVDPVVAGAGSAIYLHVWRRGGASSTSGCTSMSRNQIETLVKWLEPGALYVLLPRSVYSDRQGPWRLPPAITAS